MVSWLYKAAFLSLSLSLWVSSWSSIGFCRVHLTHHIWFALVKFLCVLWTPFWLCYLWPCQAVAQLVKSCYPSPPLSPSPFPPPLCVLSMAIRIRGLLHLTCGCDAGPEKVFTLISSYFFSHFIFRFLGFPFPFFFFYRILFAVQLAIAKPEERLQGGWGAAEVNPMRPQKQIWIFANQAANLRGKRQREGDKERPELPTLALG